MELVSLLFKLNQKKKKIRYFDDKRENYQTNYWREISINILDFSFPLILYYFACFNYLKYSTVQKYFKIFADGGSTFT